MLQPPWGVRSSDATLLQKQSNACAHSAGSHPRVWFVGPRSRPTLTLPVRRTHPQTRQRLPIHGGLGKFGHSQAPETPLVQALASSPRAASRGLSFESRNPTGPAERTNRSWASGVLGGGGFGVQSTKILL